MTARLPRFFIDRAVAPGDALSLRSDEAKHARVRRLGVGDLVGLFDGAGHSYVAKLESLSREGAVVRVSLRDSSGPSGFPIGVAAQAVAGSARTAAPPRSEARRERHVRCRSRARA